ncbi:Eco57I restriction-modification methylase domain-containing protein [Sphingobium fuliginis]|uniref:Eco57I restriction-modification methylase domain-containing protein n=1 Tax=Sphingobium fuliginis (strain ATCC 27551) TaxID=336203 RepID=UPI0010E3C953|nr:SAM-dependent DNA methyltransferase [Sphingobium fuliginis]RYL99701.1 SAM-dependent DNA methyltransferase [Sphingobium fuliginis]
MKEARIVAEDGARDAIRRLGVADSKAPTHLSDDEKELRRRLRAHARALGDALDKGDDTQETKRLVEAAAYAHWHRMLFARFLAERGLLRNPEYDVPVSLEDCRELAEAEGLSDAWAIAERYAASMLPAVFRIDDPVLALDLDPVHQQTLHRLVTGLDPEVFQAEDSLGWTYQFWRAAEKAAVNASGVKIGADELPAVTQLFTEPYMVRFLLHNTLGAWWAGKVLAANPVLARTATDEDALRTACSLPDYSFDMLRFVREDQDGHWRPAAGTFAGWPKEIKAITILDPCCGSGHFLTEALVILTALRKVEEHLSPSDAVPAALRDNLYGLEIDGRCVQIAAFAVALTAWRMGGWQTLPLPHIAWVGAAPPLPKKEFLELSQGDVQLEYALNALHDLFSKAPLLGTLLLPSGGDLFETEKLKQIELLLDRLIEKARKAEPENMEGVISARGMADAAQILHSHHTLQITNVPFLGRGKQNADLIQYIEQRFPNAKSDLATAMISRMTGLSDAGGTIAFVSPQNWNFLTGYSDFRYDLLSNFEFSFVAALGKNAFETISGEVVNVSLTAFTRSRPTENSSFAGIDANAFNNEKEKANEITYGNVNILQQKLQKSNPDHRITVGGALTGPLLSSYASACQGISPADFPRFGRYFWEGGRSSDFVFWQSTVSETQNFGGRELVLWRGEGLDRAVQSGQAYIRGSEAWGKRGVAIRQMGSLPATLYEGDAFDTNVAVIIPKKEDYLLPIWAFCSSLEFQSKVRQVDQKVNVTNATLVKVPFDLNKWTQVSAEKYPCGLPEPYSEDPTQWLFHGHPANCLVGSAIHVALARLCGYHWPAETDKTMHLSPEARKWVSRAVELPLGDNDGLVGVPAVAGEKSLADRLREFLAAAFAGDWTDALESQLVAEADKTFDKKAARDGSLEAWVRDRAFRQHCALFGQRPFLWHISDGLKDGFSIFIHYQRFDQASLRKLTYTLLGDWLARAKAENNALRYEKGRELQQKLEKVLEGEKPFDIFVRWKALAQQPLGWDPDLDDGVRQNIRPFIKAGLLTHDLSKILKDKDRGTDVNSAPWYSMFKGERRNDHHTSLTEKRSARDAMK